MATLTVFLAPDGPAAGVLDVLTDLSAAGLVAEFLWVVDADVPPDDNGRGAPDAAAVHVARGTTTATTTRSALADIPHDRRRLCVVVPVSDGAAVDSGVEQTLSGIVSFAGTRVPTTLIRVVVARPGDQASYSVLYRTGWHNVYLAPEDARGPGLPPRLLPDDADAVELGRHAAPAVAGVVGLWTGVDHTPLDDWHTPEGVRAARAFYRRIDAGMVEADLRARVLSTRPPVPKPTDQTSHTEYLPDPVAACRDVAGLWWSRHREALIGPRQTPHTPPPERVGWWTLVKKFFGFLWAVLRNLPVDVFNSAVAYGSTVAARNIHQFILGSGDAAHTVVVNGYDRNGMPVGWQTLGAATHHLDSSLAAAGLPGQPERPDLRRMWTEFTDGAMTLADAGKRSLPPVPMGAAVGVVRATGDIAPPPRADFVDIPGQFHNDVGERVAVADVLGTDVLRNQLQYFLDDHTRAPDASRTLEQLGAWQNAHRASYAVQVGHTLATNLFAVLGEIRGYLAVLREAAGQAGQGPTRPSRARVWLTWLLGILAVAGLVTAPILYVRDEIDWRWALVIGLLPLVVWLSYAISGYIREYREFFRDMHRRRELVSRVEAARANLRQATIDHGRLTEAYEQYLLWSRVVGALLDEPFGRAGAAPAAGDAITYGLPRTTRIARAQVQEDATGDAAESLRADVFRTGWLGGLWADHLGGAGRELNSAELHRRPQALLDLRGGVTESYLKRWADLLATRGPSAAPGDRRWHEVQELLRTSRRALVEGRGDGRGEGLLSSVREIGPGEQPTVALDAFLCGVNRPLSPGQEFAAEHFTATGRTDSCGEVVEHVPLQAPLGLSRVDVLVQMTAALRPADFAVTEGPRERPAPERFEPPAGYPHAEHVPQAQEEAVGRPTVVPEAPSGFL